MEDRRIIIEDAETEQAPVGIVKNPDGSMTVHLETSITANIKSRDGSVIEKTFTELKFRPLSFGDLKALAQQKFNNDLGKAYFLTLRLCKIPEAVFEQIQGPDLANCLEAVGSFFPQSQTT